MQSYIIRVSCPDDVNYANVIAETTRQSAITRGTGIGGRSVQQIEERLVTGHAVIAIANEHSWAGFCFINAYDQGRTVSHSGLIIHPEHRGQGLSLEIKLKIIELSKEKYPRADMISITTTAAVLELNSNAGFRPVLFQDLTTDPAFWAGCRGCVHFSILNSQSGRNCFCTAMKKNNHANK